MEDFLPMVCEFSYLSAVGEFSPLSDSDGNQILPLTKFYSVYLLYKDHWFAQAKEGRGGRCSLSSLILTTPLHRSLTLEGLFKMTLRSSRALTFLQFLQIYEDTVRCSALGVGLGIAKTIKWFQILYAVCSWRFRHCFLQPRTGGCNERPKKFLFYINPLLD